MRIYPVRILAGTCRMTHPLCAPAAVSCCCFFGLLLHSTRSPFDRIKYNLIPWLHNTGRHGLNLSVPLRHQRLFQCWYIPKRIAAEGLSKPGPAIPIQTLVKDVPGREVRYRSQASAALVIPKQAKKKKVQKSWLCRIEQSEPPSPTSKSPVYRAC